MIRNFKGIIFSFILFSICQIGIAGPIEINRLFCEYLDAPQSVDTSEPILGWILKSDQRGQKQTAYQVLVADSEQLLADNKGNFWHSGKVDSSESSHVVYAGQELASS